ncbi:MAG: RNA polymerase sigma factor [Candidatus Aminicenantes bacterium]|nr:RNA polymerase sigma factor [Candidatus Aminicenantes bacterium]
MKKQEELITEVLEGQNDSFEPLLRPYRQGMLNMAYRLTGNIEEAKEICQEAAIKIFKYLGSFKREKSFKNWLYKTVVNCSYDNLKKKSRYNDLIADQKKSFFDDSYNPEKNYSNTEIGEKIQKCLRVLSPKEKAVFLLRDAEGFSINEASQILGSSSNSIRTHLSRARQKLRDEFLRHDNLENGGIL